MSEDKKFWVGFDLGGTKIRASIFDDNFKVLGFEKKKTKGHEGVNAGVDRIVKTIYESIEISKVDVKNIQGIGMGCPGPLDLDKGILLDAPNLGWKNVKIKEILEKEFKCAVHIANDVDTGLYGEYCFGAAKGAHTAIGIFPGTGVGGGMIYKGEIFRGKKGSCLEIGHIRVLPDGPLCGCGQRGCLEALASRLVISSQAAQAAYRGKAPHLMEMVGTNLSEIKSNTLSEAIEKGDEVIRDLIVDASRYIGMTLGSIVNVLAPDVVILGGGLIEALPKVIKKTVEETANQYVMPSFKNTFTVEIAQMGDDATVMGAAAWAKKCAHSSRPTT